MANKADLIIVTAKIRLLTAVEGGRSTGIKTGYRTNRVFEKSGNINYLRSYMGDIVFDENEFIQPGETKTVTVQF